MPEIVNLSFVSPSTFSSRDYATQRALRTIAGEPLLKVLHAVLQGLQTADPEAFPGPPILNLDEKGNPVLAEEIPGISWLISSGLAGPAKEKKSYDVLGAALSSSPVCVEVAVGWWEDRAALRVRFTASSLSSFGGGGDLAVKLFGFRSLFADPSCRSQMTEAWDRLRAWKASDGCSASLPKSFIDDMARNAEKKKSSCMKGAILEFPIDADGNVAVDLDTVRDFSQACYGWIQVFRQWPTDRYDELEPASDRTPPDLESSKDDYDDQSEAGRLSALLVDFKPQVILTGPPGTGKTRLARLAALSLLGRYHLDFEDDPSAVSKALKEEEEKGLFRLVVFHPSMEYDSFVGGLTVTSQNGQVVYMATDGIFVRMCKTARDTGKKVVLVIDELNRGNLPRLMGELLYALEYRNATVQLSYSDGTGPRTLEIPENIYIIGTMNTADRSVDSLDVAIRRRFAFWEMEASVERVRAHWDETDEIRSEDAVKLMTDINSELGSENARGLAIGHSYFLKPTWEKFRTAWKHEIRPLLEEYSQLLGKRLVVLDDKQLEDRLFGPPRAG